MGKLKNSFALEKKSAAFSKKPLFSSLLESVLSSLLESVLSSLLKSALSSLLASVVASSALIGRARRERAKTRIIKIQSKRFIT